MQSVANKWSSQVQLEQSAKYIASDRHSLNIYIVVTVIRYAVPRGYTQ